MAAGATLKSAVGLLVAENQMAQGNVRLSFGVSSVGSSPADNVCLENSTLNAGHFFLELCWSDHTAQKILRRVWCGNGAVVLQHKAGGKTVLSHSPTEIKAGDILISGNYRFSLQLLATKQVELLGAGGEEIPKQQVLLLVEPPLVSDESAVASRTTVFW